MEIMTTQTVYSIEELMELYEDTQGYTSDDFVEADSFHCYLHRIHSTELVSADVVPTFLQLLVEESEHFAPCMFSFSVTSREGNYQAWLDAVSGIPGHTIQAMSRDGYTVYFCTFVSHPEIE